jgi:N-glycosylase/DNA lyase
LIRFVIWEFGKFNTAAGSFALSTFMPAGICIPMEKPPTEVLIPTRDYDLAATLSSGQAFRWRPAGEDESEGPGTGRARCPWEGVIGQYWVRLRAAPGGIAAQSAQSVSDWNWLTHYLQTEINFETILQSFPMDQPMRDSVAQCRGLRLLRQDPWECLASFILSSTKQIVQIQQIVGLLCARFGTAVIVPAGNEAVYSFPTAERLAMAGEHELRGCKMGFRAPNLLRTAQMIARGEVDLERIRSLALAEAREELLRLPGVGHKIANCVLLFAYGFQGAFPIDVWVMKALRQLYFPKRRPTTQRLLRFTTDYFGPNAGYAQQYLFHYMRTRKPAGTNDRSSKKHENFKS